METTPPRPSARTHEAMIAVGANAWARDIKQPSVFVLAGAGVALVLGAIALGLSMIHPAWSATTAVEQLLTLGLALVPVVVVVRLARRLADVLTERSWRERALSLGDPALRARGPIERVAHADLPALLRECASYVGVKTLRVTRQPFVVATDRGPRLIDTPYVEVFVARGALWEGALEVVVGDEVVVVGGAVAEDVTPAWASGSSRDGYRERKIVKRAGTEGDPVRVLVVTRPQPR